MNKICDYRQKIDNNGNFELHWIKNKDVVVSNLKVMLKKCLNFKCEKYDECEIHEDMEDNFAKNK